MATPTHHHTHTHYHAYTQLAFDAADAEERRLKAIQDQEKKLKAEQQRLADMQAGKAPADPVTDKDCHCKKGGCRVPSVSCGCMKNGVKCRKSCDCENPDNCKNPKGRVNE